MHNKVSSFAIRTIGAMSHHSKVMKWAAWARGKIVEVSLEGFVVTVRKGKKATLHKNQWKRIGTHKLLEIV